MFIYRTIPLQNNIIYYELCVWRVEKREKDEKKRCSVPSVPNHLILTIGHLHHINNNVVGRGYICGNFY